jgi:hypothetical protein
VELITIYGKYSYIDIVGNFWRKTMYYNPEQENLKNQSFNNQQFNRDSESSEEGEFAAESYKMPYTKDMSCKCCMYYHPKMGCMKKHPYAMNELDDPMMGEQYGQDDPPFGRPFFPRPFFHERFFPHHFHHHFHHHFFHRHY